jgi:hypothetical protein
MECPCHLASEQAGVFPDCDLDGKSDISVGRLEDIPALCFVRSSPIYAAIVRYATSRLWAHHCFLFVATLISGVKQAKR